MELSICKENLFHSPPENEDVDDTDLRRPWSDLPLELVELIASSLPLADRLRFPSVCKRWSSTSTSLSSSKRWPWLMYLPNDCNGIYKMFDPLDGKLYSMDNELPADIGRLGLRYSKDGWVLLDDDNYSIFIMNPFSPEEVVYLPDPNFPYMFYGISFSSPPTNSDCIVFGIMDTTIFNGSSVEICTWRYGNDAWSTKVYENNTHFLTARNNPVFHEGRFYCLGRCGNLGVFDPRNNSWTVLDNPTHPLSFVRESHYDIDAMRNVRRKGREQCYLVETSKGELVSVFVHNNGKPIKVCRLDKLKMSWRKVEDLGDEIVFVDARCSMSIAAPFNGTGNRIYFPRCLCEDGCPKEGVYYDLKSKNHHTNSKYDVEERATCTWIIPSMDDRKKSSM